MFQPHEILVLTEGLTYPALYVPSSGQTKVIHPSLSDDCYEADLDLYSEIVSTIATEMDDEAIFKKALAAAVQFRADD